MIRIIEATVRRLSAARDRCGQGVQVPSDDRSSSRTLVSQIVGYDIKPKRFNWHVREVLFGLFYALS